MVRIRLRRVGRKKQPSYRIVVTDKRSPRDGRYIEIIGFYNPRTQPSTIELEENRALHWLSVGAQPSESVEQLFKQIGTLDRFARLKQGEDLDQLVAEAGAAAQARGVVSPKTEHAPMSKAAKEAMKASRAAAAVAAGAAASESVIADEPQLDEPQPDEAQLDEAQLDEPQLDEES